jgi:transcriptional regulator with XRE-family HTH domain
MTPAQVRAARALLGLSQPQLAERATLSVTALRNFERGASDLHRNNLAAVRAAIEAAGAELIEADGGRGVGVRLLAP